MKKRTAAKTGLPTTARNREWTSARSISRGPSVPSRRGLDGAQRQGHRRTEHEEDRDDHRLEHVQRHVPREGDPAVDAEHAVGGVDEEQPADDPAERAQHRPGVPASAQPHDAGDVEADREQARREEEPLDPPGGEPRQRRRCGRRGDSRSARARRSGRPPSRARAARSARARSRPRTRAPMTSVSTTARRTKSRPRRRRAEPVAPEEVPVASMRSSVMRRCHDAGDTEGRRRRAP